MVQTEKDLEELRRRVAAAEEAAANATEKVQYSLYSWPPFHFERTRVARTNVFTICDLGNYKM